MLEKYVSKFKHLIETTHVKPFSRMYNFVRSSSGNRYLFVAKGFRANSVRLAVFDFEDPE